MALKKVKTTREGFTVEYWRVNPAMSINVLDKSAVGHLLGYKDAAARQAGSDPVSSAVRLDGVEEVRSVELTGAAFDAAMTAGDFRPAMYAALKAKDFFTGSEDV